ncbi:hypothetical protein DsansV1_C49g0244161 [Dioscorea sansibarensis]
MPSSATSSSCVLRETLACETFAILEHGLARLALPLGLRVLEEHAAAALSDDPGLHHRAAEPPQQDLLGLIISDRQFHVVVPRFVMEQVRTRQRREAGPRHRIPIINGD